MNEKLKETVIALSVVIGLVINYFVSVLIAKALNIYNVDVTSFSALYSDITWEIFICMLFILIEVLIIETIYRKRNNIK